MKQNIKTKKWYLASIALLLIGSYSCNRIRGHGNTTLECRVVDKTDATIVAGATVGLMEKKKEGLSNGIGSLIATATTDANGIAKFDVDILKDHSYRIVAKADKYFETTGAQAVLIEKPFKNKTWEVTLLPQGALKLRIVNISPFNSSDEISISSIGNPLYGDKVDTIYYGILTGNMSNPITYYVTKNLIEKRYTENVFVKKHDTTFSQINY